ncbi:MAG TPA: hypothetical protein VHI99_06390 [Vicinamibacterales bacterium]|jgi:hypothetical protein|nr:hypothetical protein [Vicinamibacterales bacterium]
MSLRAGAPLMLALLLTAIATAACGGSSLFGKRYEYEEDLYVKTDGSADLIVNSSIAALVSLRGLNFDTDPAARLDRGAIRAAFESPVTEVLRVSRPWTRGGRRFIQVRVRVADIRKLSSTSPFSWSHYDLVVRDGQRVFLQTVGPSAMRPGTLRNYGWTGGELVAFRLHLPSRILWHNARDVDTGNPTDVQRGNILAWEQPLTDRLDGRPISIEVRMDTQSILYRTLWLFVSAFLAAVALIGGLIWLTVRKGAKDAAVQTTVN